MIRRVWCVVAVAAWSQKVVAQQPPAQLQQARAHIAAGRFAAADSLLSAFSKEQPGNGQVWMSLGAARRGLNRVDDAAAAYQRAHDVGLRIPASQALFALYVGAKRNADAARWLDTMRTIGAPDFSSVRLTPGVDALISDPRFALLFPGSAMFDKPFVEDVTILHEWRGERAADEFGWIARPIGDVDRDGAQDVVISATANPPGGKRDGRLYVYSGKSGKLLWKTSGPPGSALGIGLEAAGDVNRDGIPDVVAGAPGLNMAIVYSGKDGAELLKLAGDSADIDLGMRASGIGDFDGDGHADVAASALSASAKGPSTGRVYVFSGKTGKRLLTLDGEQAGDGFGSTVSGGHGLLVVGAQGGGPQRFGRVYVYDRLTTKPLFVKEADSTNRALGGMFSSVIGDIDRDGTPDVYASDFASVAKGPGSGSAYVYSGKTGATLLTLTGESGGFGIGSAETGDVDKDGIPDLVIGSWQYRGAAWSGGRVQVFSGKDGHVLRTFTSRVPGETFGFDAVGVGDVNGDGFIDFLLTSAWSLVNGPRSGRAYIISGKP